MNIRTLALVATIAGASLAVAANAATNPLSYDDPGMHFQAPDGWQTPSRAARIDEPGPR